MDNNQSATSWGAIIGGAVAAAALTLVLISLGSAVGFSSVSPWPTAGVSAKTFQISTGLYLVFTAIVASTVGGYIAGRLRTKWTGLHGYEVQFRDTAHGFLAWGLAPLAGAAFLATAGALLAGGAASGVSAGGTSQANRASLAHGRLPSMWFASRNHPMALRCRRVGSVHSIILAGAGPEDQLLGYTHPRVNVRRGDFVYSYDEKGRHISTALG